MKLIDWLIGSRDYSSCGKNADRTAAILMRSGANIRNMRREGDDLLFTVPIYDCRPLEKVLTHCKVDFRRLRDHGLPRLISRYRRRIGIPIGIALFLAIIWASGQFIWTVEVVGNHTVSDSEILANLSELGCGVGTYIPSIDFDSLHSSYLTNHRNISWIAVNIDGTSASVEVRETLTAPPVPDENTPHNLIAAEDGVVQSLEIYRGTSSVSAGELVRKGQLLASGISETKKGFNLVHARGKVLAEVKRTITVEIPLEKDEKIPTGRKFSEKSLNFFGFSVKLFKNTGNLPTECDKIEREYKLCFFGVVEVPVKIHETAYEEYSLSKRLLTEEEARAEAYAVLRERCRETVEGSELISRTVSAGIKDGAYVIECRLGMITDIAEESEIYK